LEIHPVYYLTGVLALGIAAQWLAWRLRVPAIVVLLAVGFVVGSFVRPESVISPELLFPFVSLSVAVILFEGGLSLRLPELRASGVAVLRLVTVGVGVTWILAGLAAWWLLDFAPSLAAVTGALLTVSGPTVILPMLRQVRPARRVGAVIKWEGIVNDPIGAVLTALMFEIVVTGGFRGEETLGHTIAGLSLTLIAGTGLALVAAALIIQLLKRYLVPDYLQIGFVLAVVLSVFVVSNRLQSESGLVAVTILGVILANQRSVTLQHLIEFKENLRVLLISALFILLASRIELRDVADLGWAGVAFVAILLLVVRPLAVFASTVGTDLTHRERLLLAWLAPRGIVAAAVSSLFALQLAGMAGPEGPPAEIVQQASAFVALTFLVIAATVTVYGLTVGPLARLLDLSRQNPQGVMFAGAQPWAISIAKALHDEKIYVLMVDTNHRQIAAARMAGLPVCYASIVSEYVREQLDLGDVGRLLAVTANDEVNALATLQFVERFGRREVYHLAPPETTSERKETVPTHGRGRVLFEKGLTYEKLARRFAAGATIKKTPLTEDFTFAEFRERYGPTALPMFLLSESGRLRVWTAEQPPTPQPGEKLISLIDSDSEQVATAKIEKRRGEREKEQGEQKGSAKQEKE
jgi:NhaP-type Na+/H+ or K+/H+ antiporter